MMGVGHILPIITVLSFSELAVGALDFQCLKCLCETATLCMTLPCDHSKCSRIEINNFGCSCGPFGITPPFWLAANKPVLDDKGGSEAEKFKKCVESFPCSIWAIQYYMEKYAQDCDNDKLINCDDYVLIHTFGPNNCRNASLNEERLGRYKTCMSRTEIIQPSNAGSTTKSTTTTTTTTTEKTQTTVKKSEKLVDLSTIMNQTSTLPSTEEDDVEKGDLPLNDESYS
ncbi:lysozyme-like [Coccinella septempunctata]|uniref:lysozyme-like n=1 Tax=Coccinella septempunctata TaxID=41139 RepID=UPI001D0891EC|nr:lysozyme-like [Coccinella septempunctata]